MFQIKQASEDDFKSILSLFFITTTDDIHGELYSNSTIQEELITSLGMEYDRVLNTMDWKTKESFDTFVDLYTKMSKPVLFHCFQSYGTTVYGFLMEVNEELKYAPKPENTTFRQELFFVKAEVAGFNFYEADDLRQVVANIFEEPLLCFPPIPNLTLPEWWFQYWNLRPVYGNIYMSSQLHVGHSNLLQAIGITNIVNVRQPAIDKDGNNSQEEVTLLNIKDGTGDDRQTKANLEANILDANKQNDYISNTSDVNYESMNALEFGDGVGYNETMEKMHFLKLGWKYTNTPLSEYIQITQLVTIGNHEQHISVLLKIWNC